MRFARKWESMQTIIGSYVTCTIVRSIDMNSCWLTSVRRRETERSISRQKYVAHDGTPVAVRKRTRREDEMG